MLAPKRIKYRKRMKGRMRGKAQTGNYVAFGDSGMKALEASWITARLIESARIAITRHAKKGGNLFIRIFPDKPITKQPAETRMGMGKGSPEYWVAAVKPGRIMYEILGVPEDVAREAFRRASHKLPIKVKFVKREG